MRRDYGYFEEDQLGKPYDMRLLRRLFPFVRPYGLLFLLSIALVTGITVLDLALPYLTKVAIDDYIVQDIAKKKSEASLEQRFYGDAFCDLPRVFPAPISTEGQMPFG